MLDPLETRYCFNKRKDGVEYSFYLSIEHRLRNYVETNFSDCIYSHIDRVLTSRKLAWNPQETWFNVINKFLNFASFDWIDNRPIGKIVEKRMIRTNARAKGSSLDDHRFFDSSRYIKAICFSNSSTYFSRFIATCKRVEESAVIVPWYLRTSPWKRILFRQKTFLPKFYFTDRRIIVT